MVLGTSQSSSKSNFTTPSDTMRRILSALGACITSNDLERAQNYEFAKIDSSVCSLTVPSLSLFSAESSESHCIKGDMSTSSSWAHKNAVHNLDLPSTYAMSDIGLASLNIAQNAKSSFDSIIEANLFQFLKRRMRCSQEFKYSKDHLLELSERYLSKEKGNIRGSLNHSCPIHLGKVNTLFVDASQDVLSSKFKTNDLHDLLCLPVLFKMTVDVKIFGVAAQVSTQTHGNIVAVFKAENELDGAQVILSAPDLLSSMRQEARKVILKTLGIPYSGTSSSKKEKQFSMDRSVRLVTPIVSPTLSSVKEVEKITFLALDEEALISNSKKRLSSDITLPHKKRKTFSEEQLGQDSSSSAFKTLLHVTEHLHSLENV